MEALAAGLLAIGICMVVVSYFLKRDQKRLPPGPPGWPYIGNALQVDPKAPTVILTEWAKKYGDIYKIKMFGNDIVVLSGYTQIQEALVTKSQAWAGRPSVFRFNVLNDNSRSIAFDDFSPEYVKLKKLVTNALRMYGDGIFRLEGIALDVVEDLVTQVAATSGQQFDLYDPLHEAVSNTIFSIVYGRKISGEDVQILSGLESTTSQLVAPAGSGAELDIAPWLRHFSNTIYNQLLGVKHMLEVFFGRHIDQTKGEMTSDSVGCLVEALLKHQGGEAIEGRPTLREKDVLSIALSVTLAGISTSTVALYRFIALCVAQPEHQRRLQAAIDNTLGDRTPRIADRASLPLVEAAILELLRYISHVPLLLPHKTTTDVSMDGYFVPKDTRVFCNLWALHHDTRYWDAPWEYRPERFLTLEGDLVPAHHVNRMRLFPFGAGRRVCLGEALAKNRMFLVIASLLQRFEFLPGEEGSPPSCDPREYVMGLVLYPERYKIRAVKRKRGGTTSP